METNITVYMIEGINEYNRCKNIQLTGDAVIIHTQNDKKVMINNRVWTEIEVEPCEVQSVASKLVTP